MTKHTFLIFAAIIVASMALTDQQRQKMRQIRLPCLEEAGIAEEDYVKLVHEDRNSLQNNPKLKKHILCVFKKVGYITEAGDLNKDFLKERLKTAVSEEEADKVIEKCAVKKERAEETGFNLMMCLRDHGPSFSPVD